MTVRLFSALVVLLPSLALAAEAAKEPKWWEVTTGLLAIPAAIIGLIYSIVLIKKTRVEVRKTELEIKEKEAALGEIAPPESKLAQALITPLFEAKHIQLLLLRFALLYVTLQLWALADEAFRLLLGSAFLGVQQLASLEFDSGNLWLMIPLFVVSKLPRLGEWAIVLGIGLPLFRDVSAALGVDLRSIIFLAKALIAIASNHGLEGSAQQLRCWVPVALRAPAPLSPSVRPQMDRPWLRYAKTLRYRDPGPFLVRLRELEILVAEAGLPERVKVLRTNELKSMRELREAAIFCYGMSQRIGQTVFLALDESQDYDFIALTPPRFDVHQPTQP